MSLSSSRRRFLLATAATLASISPTARKALGFEELLAGFVALQDRDRLQLHRRPRLATASSRNPGVVIGWDRRGSYQRTVVFGGALWHARHLLYV